MAIVYPYLPNGRDIKYVSSDNPFMKAAMEECMKYSTDDKQPTGAIIVMNNKILGKGANQTALKNSTLKKLHENGWCVRKILNINTGEKYWLCPGCSGYETHAEARAIMDSKQHEVNLENADIYLWGHWWCCRPCWDKILEAKISNVYLLENSEVFFNRSHPDNRLGRQKFYMFLNK